MSEVNYNFPSFIDEAIEMVIAFDKSGKIVYANKVVLETLQFDKKLIGKHIKTIFRKQFQETENGFKTDIEFDGKLRNLMIYRKNRTCFNVSAKFTEDGLKEGLYTCLATDNSTIEYLEKQNLQIQKSAEEAGKVKSEFVANVTHELRTPVNGILGNTRELVALETDEAKIRFLNLIERGCRDMNQIINNILDFSKLEAGKFTLEPQPFEFRSMMDYVKANHSNKIAEKGLSFFVTVSPEIPKIIIGDELRIVQILNNLLSNATKFTSIGKIMLEALKTSQKGNKIELFFMVIDSGIGMDKADQDKLFKSFSQVDASISRRYGGTGLGLNISKQLVELMGGNISVESQKDKGTTFAFSVWVEVPEDEIQENAKVDDVNQYKSEAFILKDEDKTKEFGTEENLKELDKRLSKLILCVEMENWEKAEGLVETIKQLTNEGPREVKNCMLKLKMSVQKENYEKTIENFDLLKNELTKLENNND